MRDRFVLEWYWDGQPRTYKISARRQDFPKYLLDSPHSTNNDFRDWLARRLKQKYGIAGFKLLQWWWE